MRQKINELISAGIIKLNPVEQEYLKINDQLRISEVASKENMIKKLKRSVGPESKGGRYRHLPRRLSSSLPNSRSNRYPNRRHLSSTEIHQFDDIILYRFHKRKSLNNWLQKDC